MKHEAANRAAPAMPVWLAALGLLVLTLVVYIPSTQCGFIWDDDAYVENNETLSADDGLWRIWFEFGATQDYYPLTFTTFWLEWRLWEFRPFGYHLTNIFLHGMNAILLWRLLVRLGVPGALLAAALFAVHPVHVESVAWVTERKNVLSGLFCLLSLHAFVSFARLEDSVDDPLEGPVVGPHRWEYLVFSVGAFALAMLAKTAVIPLPLIMPVLVWWKRGRLRLGELLAAAPYFLVVSPLFIAAFISEANFAGAGVNIFAGEGAEWNLTSLERLLLCGRVLWFYVAKLLWTHPLIFVYPRWQIDSHVWWQYLFPLAAVAVPLILWRLRHRIGRGPLTAALVFGLMLGPASGFFNFYFQRYSYVADHLQYLASIAVTTLLAAMASQLTKIFPAHRRRLILLAAILVFVLAIQSWRQQAAYRNVESLWTDTLTKNPSAWIAHNNLASVMIAQARYHEAIKHCNEALLLKPNFLDAYDNKGTALTELGRLDDAFAQFQHLLQFNPNFAKAHDGLGRVLAKQERLPEAVERFQYAVRLKPDYIIARNNLGIALTELGRLEEAVEQYQTVVQMSPHYAPAYNGWGIVSLQQNRHEEALEKFKHAIRLDPDFIEARNNLGMVLTELGRFEEAAEQYEHIRLIQPD